MATIRDVAARAGVGINTVSRVINDRTGVSAATRAKIEAAIAELNYVPNEVARHFKRQTSDVVALFLPYVDNSYLAKLAHFVEIELQRLGLKLMLCNYQADLEKELTYLDIVRQNKVLGIIGLTYNDANYTLDTNIPFVSIDRFVGKKVPSVASDNELGGRLAARELIRCGCKHMVFIGDSGNVQSEVRLRRKGFKAELEEQGFEPHFHDKRGNTGFIHNDMQFIQALFDKYPEMDGVFAIADLMAAGVVEVARLRGIHVPNQVKVIGFDGIQDHADQSPYLTTLVQPVAEIAQKAVELLLAKVDNPKLRMETYRFPVTLRKGDTT
jgi:LacI family transcriptional regulator